MKTIKRYTYGIAIALCLIFFSGCSFGSMFPSSGNSTLNDDDISGVETEVLPESRVYLDIISDSNLLFSKYDIELELDGQPLVVLSNGGNYSNELSIQNGSHTLTAHKSGNTTPNDSCDIDITGDMVLTVRIKHGKSDIEFYDLEITEGMDRIEGAVPNVVHISLGEAIETLKLNGFDNVNAYDTKGNKTYRESYFVQLQSVPAGSVIKKTEEIRLSCIDIDVYFDSLLTGKSFADAEKIINSEGFQFRCESSGGAILATPESDKENWTVEKSRHDPMGGYSAVLTLQYIGPIQDQNTLTTNPTTDDSIVTIEGNEGNKEQESEQSLETTFESLPDVHDTAGSIPDISDTTETLQDVSDTTPPYPSEDATIVFDDIVDDINAASGTEFEALTIHRNLAPEQIELQSTLSAVLPLETAIEAIRLSFTNMLSLFPQSNDSFMDEVTLLGSEYTGEYSYSVKDCGNWSADSTWAWKAEDFLLINNQFDCATRLSCKVTCDGQNYVIYDVDYMLTHAEELDYIYLADNTVLKHLEPGQENPFLTIPVGLIDPSRITLQYETNANPEDQEDISFSEDDYLQSGDSYYLKINTPDIDISCRPGWSHIHSNDDEHQVGYGESFIITLTPKEKGVFLTYEDLFILYDEEIVDEQNNMINMKILPPTEHNGRHSLHFLANCDTVGSHKLSFCTRYDILTIAGETIPSFFLFRQLGENDGYAVYVTPTGERWHISADCAGPNAIKTTLSEAEIAGYTPCNKCGY